MNCSEDFFDKWCQIVPFIHGEVPLITKRTKSGSPLTNRVGHISLLSLGEWVALARNFRRRGKRIDFVLGASS